MPYLPQIKILVPSAQVSSYTTGSFNLPSARGTFYTADRGLFGVRSTDVTVEYITISSTGNGTNFGDATVSRGTPQACGSSTRILFAGGGTGGGPSNVIDYFTSASLGNAIDFGDLSEGRSALAGFASPTRGVFAGGNPGPGSVTTFTIDYVTMATTGNALDFGDLTLARRQPGGASNTTRGLIFMGENTSSVGQNVIDYITIASTGNAIDFGDSTTARSDVYSGCASSTRALHSPGYIDQTNIGYVTIASTGNATNFGTLSTRYGNWALSNKIRGVFGNGTGTNMEYVTIASTGNAATFGTAIQTTSVPSGASDCGGGTE